MHDLAVGAVAQSRNSWNVLGVQSCIRDSIYLNASYGLCDGNRPAQLTEVGTRKAHRGPR